MKVHSNFDGQKSTKRLIAFSCATALASFAFIARPAFAEEAKADNSSNLDVTAATTANVETTADLVETKVVEAPTTTENVASTENTTNVSEQATTSTASSETASETASTTASESQVPAESASGQTRETVTTDRAASATATADTNSETNVTGGQYYSDKYGYWHYKDASGKDLTGPQTIDGVKVYFNPGGVQVKGEFAWDGHYYDKNSGALVTNKFVESYGSTYYLDENGNKVIGPKEINGEWNYFDDYGEQVRNRFASDGRYYDKDGKQVDFGTNRYFQLGDYWFYAGKDGAILKGEQTIDGVKVYFYQSGVQVKGYFVRNDTDNKEHYYDKDSGALVTNNYVIAYDNYTHQNERYYVDDQGVRVKGAKTINGKQVYFTYDGRQVFDNFGDDGYFYGQDGNRVDLGTNHYVQIKGNWYYIGNDGKILTDEQTIDGAHVYFGYKGIQVKGDFDYNKQFHDKDSGNLVTNRFVTVKDKTYFIGADSKAIKGATVIDNVEYFFDKESGAQVKGDFASNDKYYDGVTGALVTNSYVQVGKNWNYVGNDGKPLKGSQTINNVPVYFDPYGGRQAKGIFGNDGYFYDKDSGAKVDLGTNRYVQVNDNWYYVNAEGKILKGDQIIDGVQVNFNPYNGIQTKELVDSNGRVISEENYNTYEAPSKFYDKNSGALVKGQYFSHDGKWYYADAEGNILKGSQTIDGVDVYFDDDGVQAKDAVLNGYYYDKDSGAGKELPHDQFIKIGNDLYYLSINGRTGNITIDGKDYYIEQNGRVLRGSFNIYQNPPYYDDETGEAVEKTGFVKSRGSWFYLENGKKIAGFKKIDGKLYYFSANPMNKYETNEQVRGKLARPKFYISFPSRAEDNPTYYFDAETGAAVTNQFVYADGHWYYFGKDGKALLFDQVINGQHLYFDYEGKQVKGDFVTDYKGTRYYDENSGELVTNETRTINGVTYHFDENGRAKQL